MFPTDVGSDVWWLLMMCDLWGVLTCGRSFSLTSHVAHVPLQPLTDGGRSQDVPLQGELCSPQSPSSLCHTTPFVLEVSMQVKLRCLQLCPLQKVDIINWVMGSVWGICCLIGVTLSVKKSSPWSFLFSVQNKLSLSLKHHLVSEHESP